MCFFVLLLDGGCFSHDADELGSIIHFFFNCLEAGVIIISFMYFHQWANSVQYNL